MKFLVWIAERTMETLFVSVIFTIAYEDPLFYGTRSIAEELIRNTFFPIMFYILSGYMASCLYFGLLARHNRVLPQVIKMAAAFSLHVGFFFWLSGDGFSREALDISLFALSAVVFANAIGSSALNSWMRKRGSKP